MKLVVVLSVAALLLLGAAFASGSQGIDCSAVGAFEPQRYMGTWYEIARYDHSFERGLREVRLHYRLLPDGRIRVVSEGVHRRTGARRTQRGKAHVAERGRLRVSYFWFFYTDQIVMELGENYEWALVGGRSPRNLWILSRTPTLPGRTFNHILRLARQRGYGTERLLYVAGE